MIDIVPSERRSAMMSGIRCRDTKPELAVRRYLHSAGFRFRLHRRDLPGSPDIVLIRYRVAVFVHGCFWHRHNNCKYAATPKTRADFWAAKFEANVRRDLDARNELLQRQWRVALVWECSLRNSAEATFDGLRSFVLSLDKFQEL
ncbi:very short patch repair endonuclease [Stenotrophomonas maltophilia]|uniref:very short patch repair endonuclease n=1 Tax=Stenotrophomonas maltophilia TaxID=40324 RepID=UPI0039C01B78